MTTIIREYLERAVERAVWRETQAKGACDPEFRRRYEDLARRWREVAPLNAVNGGRFFIAVGSEKLRYL